VKWRRWSSWPGWLQWLAGLMLWLLIVAEFVWFFRQVWQ
jgi:hypothetical protein